MFDRIRTSALVLGLVGALGLGAVVAVPLIGPVVAAAPAVGDVQGYVELETPFPVPDTPFIGADGETIKLADLTDKVTLVNFWATWCAPCVKELPALDRLEAAVGGSDFRVQLISLDRAGSKVYAPFLEDLGIENLRSASDKRTKLIQAMKGRGVPASYIIDREGMVRGYLLGIAEWDSEDAKALMRYYMEAGS